MSKVKSITYSKANTPIGKPNSPLSLAEEAQVFYTPAKSKRLFEVELVDPEAENLLISLVKLNLIKFRKIDPPFEAIADDDEEADLEAERAAVKEQLRIKYVETGKWKKMSRSKREDATEVEIMQYRHAQGDYLSEEETKEFLAEMRKQVNEHKTRLKV